MLCQTMQAFLFKHYWIRLIHLTKMLPICLILQMWSFPLHINDHVLGLLLTNVVSFADPIMLDTSVNTWSWFKKDMYTCWPPLVLYLRFLIVWLLQWTQTTLLRRFRKTWCRAVEKVAALIRAQKLLITGKTICPF